MTTDTLKLITEIVDHRFGFITDDDVPTLLDAGLDYCRVLIRADHGRQVVYLKDVPRHVALLGSSLRDVAFTADECARLREHA